jgi:DNA-binding MarR family transcriptional regulator
MSLQKIADWAFDARITPTQKLILICLADLLGSSRTGIVSQQIIARHSSLSRTTVNRNLKILEKQGQINSHRQKDESGRELPKQYQILSPTGEKGCPTHG